MLEQGEERGMPPATQRGAQRGEVGAEPREERWNADGSCVLSARLRISCVLKQLKRTPSKLDYSMLEFFLEQLVYDGFEMYFLG